MQLQVVVDCHKKFTDIFVGMSRSMNEVCILRLHRKATNGNLVQIDQGESGIKPYIIVDKGYPLLPWLMILHKQGNVPCIILESLFNR
jgi:hypothetical protein